MTVSRTDLEKQLVADPFNAAIRLEYAQLLLAGQDWLSALQQFTLVQQHAPSAAALTGSARCLLALERRPEALQAYAKAREQTGFTAVAELDLLERSARPVSAAPFTVIQGGANVVRLRPEAKEQIRFVHVGGMEDLKKTLRMQIIEPFLRPSLFARFKKQAGGGILLYGPPGCGKTMIARAIANECNAAFISVGISDILNMWIGESEKNIALMFEKARTSKPCVLFFDELDALAFSRSKANSDHSRTTVNEFLAQLDGFGSDNRDVLFLAATNMPWDVDSAMKRPGRFARQIFVPPPDDEARRRIIEMKLDGVPCTGVNIAALAAGTTHCSGADLDGLIELAKDHALESMLSGGDERALNQADFDYALQAMTPSTLDWLKTARNLVKYAGDNVAYRDVEQYLKKTKFL